MPILHPSLFFQKTPMLFVVVFLWGSLFLIGPSPMLRSLLLVRRHLLSLTGIHTGCMLKFKWQYFKMSLIL